MTDITEIMARAFVSVVQQFDYDERGYPNPKTTFDKIPDEWKDVLIEEARGFSKALKANGYAIVPVKCTDKQRAAMKSAYFNNNISPFADMSVGLAHCYDMAIQAAQEE